MCVDGALYHASAAGVLLAVAVRKAIQRAREAKDPLVQQRLQLRRQLEGAKSFDDWKMAATKLDALEGNSVEQQRLRWKREVRLYGELSSTPRGVLLLHSASITGGMWQDFAVAASLTTPACMHLPFRGLTSTMLCHADRNLLHDRLNHLTMIRERGQVAEMMFAVRADLIRNLGNMASRCGTQDPFHCMPAAFVWAVWPVLLSWPQVEVAQFEVFCLAWGGAAAQHSLLHGQEDPPHMHLSI